MTDNDNPSQKKEPDKSILDAFDKTEMTEATDLPPLSSIGPVEHTIAHTETGSEIPAPTTKQYFRQIGPYRIIREIGEGGMGSVYEAEQKEPVKRRVALKVIKAGRDSKNVIARFEAERQALAMMDHPTIARILDAGETEFGQPYFAMELVDGVPLTDYCDHKTLSITDRLRLFRQICDGVQHAHQKGIIHRDLKPRNILVTEYDGKPSPKIIDFGLAKALETTDRLTDKPLATEFGQVLGTIKYMSPEQAGLNALDVDTRSDIYSLGIILYELLTGTTPLESQSIEKFALVEVLELVREKQAPRPSQRVSTDSKRLSSISSRRQIEPRRLNSILTGELDWVVMKSLEKDRQRRYSSASEFSDDINRYLNNDPILARPPSRTYQLQKFVRRNKGLVTSLATIITLLIAGIGGTTLFAVRERAARDLAEQNEERANDNAKQSEKDRAEAEKSAKRAKDSLQIFTKSFRSVDPSAGANAKMMAKDVLFNAQNFLKNSDLDDDGKSELLASLTDAFLGVGEYKSAVSTGEEVVEIRKKVFGPRHFSTLKAMSDLVRCYQQSEDHEQSLNLGQAVLQLNREIFGPEHPDTLTALANLGTSYVFSGEFNVGLELLQKAFQQLREKLEADDPQTLSAMNNLANAYGKAGNKKKALELIEEVFELRRNKLGRRHPKSLVSMSELAVANFEAGNTTEALRLNQELLLRQTEVLGAEHPGTLITMGNLAFVHRQIGQLEQAQKLEEKVFDLRRNSLGADHPGTLGAMNNLGATYFAAGKFEEAAVLFEDLLVLRREKLGFEHPETMNTMGNLAQSMAQLGRFKEAVEIVENLLELRRRRLGEGHPRTMLSKNNLALGYSRMGRFQDAQVLYQQVVNSFRESLGIKHPDTLIAMSNLADSYRQAGLYDDSLKLHQDVLKIRERIFARDNPKIFKSKSSIARVLYMLGKFKDALILNEEVLEFRKVHLGSENPDTWSTMNNLSVIYMKVGRIEESIKIAKELLDLRRAKFGDEHPVTLNTMANLAAAYAKMKDYVKAQELDQKVLALRRKVLGLDHPKTIESMNHVALNFQKQDRLDLSTPMLEKVVELRVQKFGRNHPMTLLGIGYLGANYRQAKRLDEAIPLLEEVYSSKKTLDLTAFVEDLRKSYLEARQFEKLRQLITELVSKARASSDPQKLDAELIRSGAELIQIELYADAENLLEEYFQRMKTKDATSWLTYRAQSMLGSAQSKQRKLADAKPMLVQGFEGMKANADKIPDEERQKSLLSAVNRLIEFSTETGADADLKKWEAEKLRLTTESAGD